MGADLLDSNVASMAAALVIAESLDSASGNANVMMVFHLWRRWGCSRR